LKKRKYLKGRGEIAGKRHYTKPIVVKFAIDNSISLVMMTTTPPNPPPRGGTNKGSQEPFQSPFGDKPFS
jgi:hypothetical protein